MQGYMDQLIPLINKLQDVFNVIGYDPLDLPQIVVVGSQSSGKSSVLENIVMKDFLPRGRDIVTRRPLVLQLIHEKGEVEWGEFLHLPGDKFTDFDKIRDEIERETEKVAGKNKGISKIPIHLRIHSHKVLNLTLVDLPGITKIPIGDQPTDIESQIKQLVYDYICKSNSIILAVTPANIDLVNSEALKIAREVDPEGKRTIGVLTKIDLMDAGTNALDILMNKSCYRLRHGFIGVVNRSQQDINVRKAIEDSIKSEQEYFKTHPVYRSIAAQCGVSFLSKSLNTILINHIKEVLPDIRNKINALIINAQNDLQTYGEVSFQGAAHKGTVLLGFLTKFSNDFNDSIEGNARNISVSDICGGARINHIFNDIFPCSLTQMEDTNSLSLMDVRTAIRNSSGPRPSLFVPEVSFDLLVKKQISKLKGPSLRCLELVFEEVLGIIFKCDKNDLMRFPKLGQRIIEVASDLVRERLDSTTSMIDNLISIELAYINTNHPDFIRAGVAISTLGKVFEKRKKKETLGSARKPGGLDEGSQLFPAPPIAAPSKDGGLLNYLFKGTSVITANPPTPKMTSTPLKSFRKTDFHDDFLEASISQLDIDEGLSSDSASFMSEKEEMETHLILSLIQSYYGVVKKNLQDSVPKSIMHFLVNFVKENLQNRLVHELYKEDLFSVLLEEDEAIAKEREKVKQALDVYKKAGSIIAEIRESNY